MRAISLTIWSLILAGHITFAQSETVAAAAALFFVTQIKASIDVTEDCRNSFALADANQLARLTELLAITVRLAAEDPAARIGRRQIVDRQGSPRRPDHISLAAAVRALLLQHGFTPFSPSPLAQENRAAEITTV